ncbi:MAG: hypothetical protein M1426_04925 [Patescibacteria group bacterium]|nr:hypothetical protein [Patescibacteria group bacterium]
MLGLGDFWVALIFIITILSVVVCVVYGYMYWNKEGEATDVEFHEEQEWAKEEKKIENNL